MVDQQEMCRRVEEAVSIVYGKSTENQRREANIWLQKFTASSELWATIEFLLRSESPRVGFVSTHAVYSRIKKDWKRLPQETQRSTHSILLGVIHSHVTSPATLKTDQITLQRVTLALAAIVIQTPGAVASHVAEAQKLFQIGVEACKLDAESGAFDPEGSPSEYAKKANRAFNICTELLHGLPEEQPNAGVPLRVQEVADELLIQLPIVLGMLEKLLLTSDRHVKLELKGRAIDCIQAWAKTGISVSLLFNSHRPLLELLMHYLLGSEQDLMVAASNALLSIVGVKQYPIPSGQAEAFDAIIGTLVNARSRIAQTVVDSDEVSGHAIVRVIATVAEECAEQLALGNNQALPFVELVMDCTGHPIRQVARHTIDFWLNLQDVDMSDRHPNLREPCFARLLNTLIRQCQLGMQDRCLDDVEYDISNFRSASDGVADGLETCWDVLQANYFETLLGYLGNAQTWTEVEAILFAMKSVSRVVKSFVKRGNAGGPSFMKLCTLLNSLFSSLPQHPLLQVHPLVLSAATQLVGEYAAVLSAVEKAVANNQSQAVDQSHSLVIHSATPIVVLALSNPESSQAGSIALQRLGAGCAIEVARQPHVLQQIIGAFQLASQSDLSSQARRDGVQGIVRVISAMQDFKSAANCLEALVLPIVTRLSQAISSSTDGRPHGATDVKKAVANELECLETVFQFLECKWPEGQADPMVKLLESCWQLLERLPMVFVPKQGEPQDSTSVVFKALYSLYSRLLVVATSTMTSQLGAILGGTVVRYQVSQDPWCLDCIAKAVEMYSDIAGGTLREDFTQLINSVSTSTFELVRSGGAEDRPEVLQSFFSMAHRFIVCSPACIVHASSFATIFELAVLYTAKQEKESTRMALKFVAEVLQIIVSAKPEWNDYRQRLAETVQQHGETLTRNLLTAIVSTAPEILCGSLANSFSYLAAASPAVVCGWCRNALVDPAVLSGTATGGSIGGGSSNDATNRITPEVVGQIVELLSNLHDDTARTNSLMKDVFGIARGSTGQDVLLSYVLTS